MTTLYRKYRPTKFSELSGQKYVIKTLTGAIKNNRIGHAYLFTGPRGTGKTTLARIFAKTINCDQPQTNTGKNDDIVRVEPCNKCQNCQTIINNQAIDLVEIDAASHTGVDNIRQLKEGIDTPPSALKYKVYIIDEVHMLSTGAFNALLKTLEEPPAHIVFILATTELHKVPETIISRCQRFNIKPLTKEQIIKRLQQIAEKEKVTIEEKAISIIADMANGGMRDAESLLGQLISLGSKTITVGDIRENLGITTDDNVHKIITFIINNQLPDIVKLINALQEEGINLKIFGQQLLEFVRDMLLIKVAPENKTGLLKTKTTEEIDKLEKLTQTITLPNLLLLISLLQTALTKSTDTDIPQLPLEMALIEYSLKTASSTTKSTDNAKKNETNRQSSLKKKSSDNSIAKKQPSTDNTVSLKTEKSKPPVEKNIPENNTTSDVKIDIAIETVLEKWNDILEEIAKQHQSILAFLENCTPLLIDQQSVIIRTRYPFHKTTLENTKNKTLIEQVFSNVLEAPVRIKFVTEDEAKEIEKNNTNKSVKKPNGEALLYEAMKKVGGKIIDS